MEEVVREGGGLRVELSATGGAPPGSSFWVLEKAPAGPGPEVVVYRGVLEAGPGRRSRLQVSPGGDALEVRRADDPLARLLKPLPAGSVVVVDAARGVVEDWLRPVYTYREQTAAVLADGRGLRALVIPLDGPAQRPFRRGMHQLRFRLERARWEQREDAEAHDLQACLERTTLSVTL
jgi:hypothetical protein